MVPPIDDVQSTLEPYHFRILSVVLEAWKEWTESRYAARWRTPRGRANFVWEEMAARALETFHDDPRIRIEPRSHSFWFIFDGKLVVRLKKGDAEGFSSNISTTATLDFHDPQMSLPNLDAVHRVEVQYQLDAEETAIADICVVCRNGADVAWTYSILSLGSDVSDMPLASEAQDVAPRKSLVRPRQATAGNDSKSTG